MFVRSIRHKQKNRIMNLEKVKSDLAKARDMHSKALHSKAHTQRQERDRYERSQKWASKVDYLEDLYLSLNK